MKNKQKIIGACLAVSFMLVCGSIGLFAILAQTTSAPAKTISVNGNNTAQTEQTATVSPVIYDGQTNQPIEGAIIIIPEAGYSGTTDALGSAGKIEVPILSDDRFDELVKKSWGEVTILVYKDGYRPYALFYTEVYGGENRVGPNIYMYAGQENVTDPFSLIEGPNRLWAKDIIEKYRP